MAKINLYDLTPDELKAKITEWGLPAFRAKQVWEWLYTHKAATFDQMTNLPKPLRDTLADKTTLGVLEPVEEIFSNDGQTIKRLFKGVRDKMEAEKTVARAQADGQDSPPHRRADDDTSK